MHILPRMLGAKAMPQPPDTPLISSFAAFVEQHLPAIQPHTDIVQHYHQLLMDYIRNPDPTFITRKVSGQERRKIVTTRDGARLLPSDNSPAWFWHSVMFNNIKMPDDQFKDFVRHTPTHFFDVSRFKTLNSAGWHAAHILDAKDGNTDWQAWSTEDVIRRFIRNVHPLNLFYVPKTNWRRVGGDPQLIGYVAWAYSERWPDMWAEFTDVAGQPMLRPKAGDLKLRLDVPRKRTRKVSKVAGNTPKRSAAATDRASWSFILGASRPKPITAILVHHPQVEARTRRLAQGLTVERFVALGDALFNKTRQSMLETRAPGDPRRQAEIAFDLLDEWISKTYRKPSGWTGAIKLLESDANEYLEQIKRLDILGLATAALRVIDGPYNESNKRGLR